MAKTPRFADMKFNALLTGKKDNATAYAWAEEIVEADWDNANALNAMAWGIVDEMPARIQRFKLCVESCKSCVRTHRLQGSNDSRYSCSLLLGNG